MTTDAPTVANVTNGAVENTTAPLSQKWQLANGTWALFEMPDMFAFADGSFDIPNEFQADLYELIYGNALSELHPALKFNYNRQKLKGLYCLFAIVCKEPKITFHADLIESGELYYRQVGWADVTAAYSFFRNGPPNSIPITTMQESQMVASTDEAEETSE